MKSPIARLEHEQTQWPLDGRSGGGRSRAVPAGGFASLVADLQGRGQTVVRQGDNLTHMVKARAQAQGVRLDESTAYRLALRVAKHNQIGDADQISPGQRVDFSAVDIQLASRAASALAPSGKGSKAWQDQAVTSPPAAQAKSTQAPVSVGEVLDRTLQRAVAKGFIPAQEQAQVRQRVEMLADKYGFSADDFAVLSLMESNGLNPQASNGNCHGVIQFCDGENRGAASVGMARDPEAILGMGVLTQLDLVDRYLADAGVQPGAGLDDLYLAVLMPAARSELNPNAPLPIAGRQASVLYVNQNPRAYITRASLAEGLLSHASTLLGLSLEGMAALRPQTKDAKLAASN